MNRPRRRFFLALPVAALLVATPLLLSAGCELAVNLNAPLDGAVSDVIDCSICADVSADADYDAADVSIYGLPGSDAGSGADATPRDAGRH